MKAPYLQASYLAQVRRLTGLAQQALKSYPIDAKKISFIHHGENTTFCILDKRKNKYLLRIHREGYHTKEAIEEELGWLKKLSSKGLHVPSPVRNLKGQLVEVATHPDVPGSKNCSVMKWQEGRFIDKSLKPHHLFELGKLIGLMQKNSSKCIHRNYWTTVGLLGSRATWGSVKKVELATARELLIIQKTRKFLFKKLANFEKRFPERLCLIHADLHFGNIILSKNAIAAIDFDDCGYGFKAYDLVIPIISTENILNDVKKTNHLEEYKRALIEGYKTYQNWDQHDEQILPYLISARKLLTIGWLNSRSDNPRLQKHLKGAIQRLLKHVKLNYPHF